MLGERLILAIGYKYNSRKVKIICCYSRGGGGGALGIPYLSKYPDKFSNVSILPVACPHLISKFIGSVNELDSQNKSWQSDLALEKF